MAPSNSASNWLSFSLSSMDFLAPPQPHPAAAAPQFFLDNFYSNEWGSAKEHGMYDTAEDCGAHHQNHQLMAANYIETPVSGVPKLEDFLGGDTASLVRYSGADTSQTETQDSSLTHIYEPHHLFHHHHHHQQQQEDLKAVTVAAATPGGFAAAFSGANSGSDVEDSANQVEFVGQNEVAYGGGVAGGLSLAVAQTAEKGVGAAIVMADSDSVKKIADTFGQRTSIYRGVTRHRWTGRYEAHLWDNSCRREGQARKGRQVYLGGYDKEEKAARSYDLAALKYWGPTATTNFPVSNYTKELEEMKRVTKQEFIASLRRKSSGFSRGASIYRGVTRHHQQGRWQARIGRVAGNKDLYLGTFATEEEAAEAYDIAAIKFRGVNAVTNFEMSRYDVDAILKSNLPIGGAAKRLKLSPESSEQKPAPPLTLTHHHQQTPAPQLDQCGNATSTINFAAIQPAQQPSFDSTASLYHQILFHHLGATTMGQPMVSDSLSSATSMVGPMTLMTPQPPPPQAEFYIWPHQSY